MSDARHIAIKVLMRVEHNSAFAAAALEAELSGVNDPRDASLATELVLGTLRNRMWLDHLLQSAASKGISSLDPEIMWILRVAVYQISMLERVPARAAVSEAVNMIKKTGASKKLPGFANGILRNLARRNSDDLKPTISPDESSIDKLCTACSIPLWLGKQIAEGRGISSFVAMARRFNAPSRRTLRINRGRIDVPSVLGQLADNGGPGELLPWSVQVFTRDAARKLEADGLAVNQDEGAGLVVLALDPSAGDRILDACAGRGGKTGTIAMITDNKADILAVDRKRNKLDRLEFELHRQGFNPETLVADLTNPELNLKGPYDRILVDAPCTGTGTMGRRPEIRWRLEPSDVKSLIDIQKRILNGVAPLLAPGGRLVFATCSVLKEEHEGHLNSFLKKFPEFKLVRNAPEHWPKAVDWNNGTPFVNPGETSSDGYGILCLEIQG